MDEFELHREYDIHPSKDMYRQYLKIVQCIGITLDSLSSLDVVLSNQSTASEKLISIAKEVQCYVINVVGIKELACGLRRFKAYKFSENQQCLVNVCKAIRNAYAHSSLLIPSYKAKCTKGSCAESYCLPLNELAPYVEKLWKSDDPEKVSKISLTMTYLTDICFEYSEFSYTKDSHETKLEKFLDVVDFIQKHSSFFLCVTLDNLEKGFKRNGLKSYSDIRASLSLPTFEEHIKGCRSKLKSFTTKI
ncbi:hypothetical protein KUL42_13280 [Alteromonas sp. KUL42]|uniref:hypothetical protein n=1 Tax=Alteromonas sp. KUL42 TaxID=2480797 RepID=UPI001036EA0B|nr:hypothetical protein [Alteromonas sp. KUL42]TAP37147.1 hypothetical protein EYR97_06565 [Alteromonas sp. KUL42]GEA06567.1 hypothetical protein KUL42_13280 [Alteromonas sp. KUL42]